MQDRRSWTSYSAIMFAALAAGALAVSFAACVPVPTGSRRKPPASPAESARRDSAMITNEELVRVRRLRIYGVDGETSPPILRLTQSGKTPTGIGSDALTLSLDMQSATLPNPVLQLVHCDRNWKPTESIFIQDIVKLRTGNFRVQRVGANIRYYDYTLDITFPQADQNIRIEHSGNYLARVVDYYDRDKILAEGRFFVVEQKASVAIGITSDFYQSAQTKVVQRGLRARVEAMPANDLYGSNISAIYLIKDSHWYLPAVAGEGSADRERRDGGVWTSWDSFFGSHAIAQFLNIPAGNEYRQLDLTNLSLYPATGSAISTPLSDLPRGGLGAADYNGVIHPRIVETRDDDYLLFEFRLDLKGREAKQDLFVVGTFNNWLPGPEWQLQYDPLSRFYKVRCWIKRAYHEYEYVAGSWDDDNRVLRDADATLLEGNISLSTHSFHALVYYRDPTLGGFDRIIGVGRTEGSFW